MNRQEFIAQMQSRDDNAARLFMRTWNNVLAFEQRIGKTLDEGFTREEYANLMSSMTKRSGSYTNRKSDVMLYVRTMVEAGVMHPDQISILSSVHFKDSTVIGTVEQAEEHHTKIKYFKNLAALRQAVEKTASMSSSYDMTLYNLPASILYLAWMGLSEEEIVQLKKTDFDWANGVIHLSDRNVEIPKEIQKFFHDFCISDGFYQKARGVIFRKYTESEYFIRSDKMQQLDVVALRSCLYRMNKISGRLYSLSYDTAYQSGAFFRAYMMECSSADFDLSDPVVAADILKENTSSDMLYYSAINNYKFYKRLFNS